MVPLRKQNLLISTHSPTETNRGPRHVEPTMGKILLRVAAVVAIRQSRWRRRAGQYRVMPSRGIRVSVLWSICFLILFLATNRTAAAQRAQGVVHHFALPGSVPTTSTGDAQAVVADAYVKVLHNSALKEYRGIAFFASTEPTYHTWVSIYSTDRPRDAVGQAMRGSSASQQLKQMCALGRRP